MVNLKILSKAVGGTTWSKLWRTDAKYCKQHKKSEKM